MPFDGAVQMPLAEVLSSGPVCVRPPPSEKDVQAEKALEFSSGKSAPVSFVMGEIANPTKLAPESVTLYSVPGEYMEFTSGGEKVNEKLPDPSPRFP